MRCRKLPTDGRPTPTWRCRDDRWCAQVQRASSCFSKCLTSQPVMTGLVSKSLLVCSSTDFLETWWSHGCLGGTADDRALIAPLVLLVPLNVTYPDEWGKYRHRFGIITLRYLFLSDQGHMMWVWSRENHPQVNAVYVIQVWKTLSCRARYKTYRCCEDFNESLCNSVRSARWSWRNLMPYLPSLPSLLFSYRHLSFVMYQTQNFNVLPPHMLWKRPAATLMLWLLSSAQLNKHSSHLQVGRRCDVCLSRRVQPPLLLSSPTPLPVPPSPSFSLSEAKVRLVQVHGSLQLPSEKDQNFLRRFNLKDYCILF